MDSLVPRYNPHNSEQLRKLRDAMAASSKALRPVREEVERMTKVYAGSHYMGTGNQRQPVTLFQLAMRIYRRQISGGTPQALITTNYAGAATQCYEFQIALNYLLRMMNFRAAMAESFTQAMFRMGICKIGITQPEEARLYGMDHISGQPYCEPILLDDWIHDTTARREEQQDFRANRYRVPLEEAKENPLYDKRFRDKLRPSEKGETSSDNFGEGEASQTLGHDNNMLGDVEFREHVDLWDVWLPRDRLLVTVAADDPEGKPARVVEWEGPRNGPFELLCLDVLPGNVVPVSMASSLIDMNELINSVYRKLADQARRQKSLAFASGMSTASGKAQAIIDAADGEALNCDDPNAVKEVHLGGIDQPSLAFAMHLKDIFSYIAGNMDSLGGLSQQGKTLGQEELIAASSGTLVGELQGIMNQYTERCQRGIGYYLWTDRTMTWKLTKPIGEIGGVPINVDFDWTPERRTADYYGMVIEINPYSMREQGPQQRLQGLMQAAQMLLPMLSMMQQDGLKWDWQEFVREISKLGDIDSLASILKTAAEPMAIDPMAQQQGGDMHGPATTTRNYVRRNVAGGPTPQNQTAQMVTAMMGSNDQGRAA